MIVSDQDPNGSSTTQYINLQFSDQQDIGEEDEDEGQVITVQFCVVQYETKLTKQKFTKKDLL